jgi:hypothetical protein
VQVLTDQGLPARDVYLSLLGNPQVGTPLSGGAVDADGCNTLRGAPGLHHLLVRTFRDVLTDQEVMLKVGLNPDVVVRLPAGAGR